MKSLLDPSFHYVPSIKTDLRKTFARIRREQRGKDARYYQLPARDDSKVASLFLLPKRLVK